MIDTAGTIAAKRLKMQVLKKCTLAVAAAIIWPLGCINSVIKEMVMAGTKSAVPEEKTGGKID